MLLFRTLVHGHLCDTIHPQPSCCVSSVFPYQQLVPKDAVIEQQAEVSRDYSIDKKGKATGLLGLGERDQLPLPTGMRPEGQRDSPEHRG